MAAGLLAIFILFILPKAPGPTTSLADLSGKKPSFSFNSASNSASDTKLAKTSSFANSVTINTGNASYSYEPLDEYIELTNNRDSNINLSGWKLQNAKGERTYTSGNNVQNFASDIVTIPRAVRTLSPYGANVFEDVVLKPSESAVITTGTIGVTTPFKIVNFKESLCTGYIENLPEYSFTPSLERNCVAPRDEPGLKNLDTQCQDYVRGMQSCHTPKFDTVDSSGRTADRQGNTCNGCVDGNNSLSGQCVAFIRAHFSYQGCLANHQNDVEFEGSTWRIFLGKPWELWAKQYETISLFDSLGQLVNYVSY